MSRSGGPLGLGGDPCAGSLAPGTVMRRSAGWHWAQAGQGPCEPSARCGWWCGRHGAGWPRPWGQKLGMAVPSEHEAWRDRAWPTCSG